MKVRLATAFEWHVLARPWHRGRVVLIGDAAPVCPTTAAQVERPQLGRDPAGDVPSLTAGITELVSTPA